MTKPALLVLEDGTVFRGTAIGAEGRAIRAEGYLTHFKKRVFAGLGVSQIDVGDGDTTNRATANTLSRSLIDAVKDVQDELEAQWDHEVVAELLEESTFGETVLDEENLVHLRFAEIDIQNKMEQEAHALQLFEKNAITYDELRAEVAREPILVPEDPEDQDMTKYSEWFMTYWKLFEEPLNLIRAVDEPFSSAAQASAEARSLYLTQKALTADAEARAKREAQAASAYRATKITVANTCSQQKH